MEVVYNDFNVVLVAFKIQFCDGLSLGCLQTHPPSKLGP